MKKLLAIMPAAMVPGAVITLQRTHVPDGASGAIIGVLLGLSIVALIRQRRCRLPG